MKNYCIEGDIDFMKELKLIKANLANNIPNAVNSAESKNICLITNTPLTDYCVTLACAHRFNYIPLYNDILNHKKKLNTMETTILSAIQIRCPYCRNVQSELLPYYNIPDVKKIHGVNFFNENIGNKKHNEITGICEYVGEDQCTNPLVAKWENGQCYCSYHTCKMACLKSEKLQMLHEKHLAEKKAAILEKQKALEVKKAAAEAKKAAAEAKKAAAEAKKVAAEAKKVATAAKKAAAAEKKKEKEEKKKEKEEKKKEKEEKKKEKDNKQ